MANGIEREEIASIAKEAMELLGTGRQAEPFSARFKQFAIDDAYDVTTLTVKAREARGERPAGRKIGFTNRVAWAGLGISAPFWSYVFDTTVHDLAALGNSFSLAGFAEPRIEPEIVVGLAASPRAGMSEAELLACIEWIAHGFEIVQCIYPGWVFSTADAIADHGLHGALVIGPRHPISPDLAKSMAGFSLGLRRGNEIMATGHAQDVLGGPLNSLLELAALLASDPRFEPLQPGEVVTTGTLAAAQAVAPGETWSTKLSNTELGGISVTFT